MFGKMTLLFAQMSCLRQSVCACVWSAGYSLGRWVGGRRAHGHNHNFLLSNTTFC